MARIYYSKKKKKSCLLSSLIDAGGFSILPRLKCVPLSPVEYFLAKNKVVRRGPWLDVHL